MAIQTTVQTAGMVDVLSFFTPANAPKQIVGFLPPFSANPINVNWERSGGEIRTTNNMASSNEIMWKIRSGLSLPTQIALRSEVDDYYFGTFNIEGGSVAYDDVLLYGQIKFVFNT